MTKSKAMYQVYRDTAIGSTNKGFSVKHRSKVVSKGEAMFIYDAWFDVSLAQRERVRAEGKKYVHATVRSYTRPKHFNIKRTAEHLAEEYYEITYNPFNDKPYFYLKHNGEKVEKFSRILLQDGKVYVRKWRV